MCLHVRDAAPHVFCDLSPPSLRAARPQFRACGHSSYPFAGKLANGAYFIVPADADNSLASGGTRTLSGGAQFALSLSSWLTAIGLTAVSRMEGVRASPCDRACEWQ